MNRTETIAKYAAMMMELPYSVGEAPDIYLKHDGRIYCTADGADFRNITERDVLDITSDSSLEKDVLKELLEIIDNKDAQGMKGYLTKIRENVKRDIEIKKYAYALLYENASHPHVGRFSYDRRRSNSCSTRQMSSMVESSMRSLVEWGSTMRGPMQAIWMPG